MGDGACAQRGTMREACVRARTQGHGALVENLDHFKQSMKEWNARRKFKGAVAAMIAVKALQEKQPPK